MKYSFPNAFKDIFKDALIHYRERLIILSPLPYNNLKMYLMLTKIFLILPKPEGVQVSNPDWFITINKQ